MSEMLPLCACWTQRGVFYSTSQTMISAAFWAGADVPVTKILPEFDRAIADIYPLWPETKMGRIIDPGTIMPVSSALGISTVWSFISGPRLCVLVMTLETLGAVVWPPKALVRGSAAPPPTFLVSGATFDEASRSSRSWICRNATWLPTEYISSRPFGNTWRPRVKCPAKPRKLLN